MFTFRQKTFLSFLALFLVFSAIIFVYLPYHDRSLAIVISLLFFLFGAIAWTLIYFFTKPIKTITQAIRNYQEGKEETLPNITLPPKPRDEFRLLGETINSLSKKVQNQIQTLTREKNNKAAILASLGEGVIAVDASMTVTYINHIAEKFLDIKKDDLVGKSLAGAGLPLLLKLVHEAEGKKDSAIAVLKVGKKPRKYLDVIAVPRGNEGAILVLQDKTSLHKVIELGHDFIANASHELKTPITIIRGFAETLHDHPELSHEVYKEITQKIVSNCGRMETLVRNLLTLAAIDEGLPSSRLQEVDLLDLVEQARQTILTIHPTAEIAIKAAPEMYALADGDLLIQAILNLLDNAVKYSKQPAHVTVFLEKSEQDAIIRVQDQGVGIPGEDLDRIFERFYAVDKSHSRSLGGSGLGLSIVERIVEKHKGSIDVESELGKGSTFILRIPNLDEEY